MDIEQTLNSLRESGNFRQIPAEQNANITDLSSNDYLGLGARDDLRDVFFATKASRQAMSASASRLLGAIQQPYASLERLLAESYGHGREALLFNSGYHANTGLVSAIADKKTLIVADRLVHASIIDGIKLSGAQFTRFPHNDFVRLEEIVASKINDYERILIIVESVYSMDGDTADIRALTDIKRRHGDRITLYVDEAHAVGVCGPAGLGLVALADAVADIDIIVGTFGKALASVGAFAVMSPTMRDFMVNKARSLIFSTALPPLNIAWTEFIFRRMMDMDTERDALAVLGRHLANALNCKEPCHIRPLIVGDPRLAVELSNKLLAAGFKVLPIRTPTVPPGTERLRFSLSAAITTDEIDRLGKTLETLGIR